MPHHRAQWIAKNRPVASWLTKRKNVKIKLELFLLSINKTLIRKNKIPLFHPSVEQQLLQMNSCFTQEKLCLAASYLYQWIQQTIQTLPPTLNPNNHVIKPIPSKTLVKLIHDFIIEIDSGEKTPLQLHLIPIPEIQDLIKHLPQPNPLTYRPNNAFESHCTPSHPLEGLSCLLIFFAAFFAGFFLDIDYDYSQDCTLNSHRHPRPTPAFYR